MIAPDVHGVVGVEVAGVGDVDVAGVTEGETPGVHAGADVLEAAEDAELFEFVEQTAVGVGHDRDPFLGG